MKLKSLARQLPIILIGSIIVIALRWGQISPLLFGWHGDAVGFIVDEAGITAEPLLASCSFLRPVDDNDSYSYVVELSETKNDGLEEQGLYVVILPYGSYTYFITDDSSCWIGGIGLVAKDNVVCAWKGKQGDSSNHIIGEGSFTFNPDHEEGTVAADIQIATETGIVIDVEFECPLRGA